MADQRGLQINPLRSWLAGVNRVASRPGRMWRTAHARTDIPIHMSRAVEGDAFVLRRSALMI